jgi:hypothetical protein
MLNQQVLSWALKRKKGEEWKWKIMGVEDYVEKLGEEKGIQQENMGK